MSENNRPLVVTSSLALIDDIVRLASSSALEVQVAADCTAAADHWLSAPLVLVGSDARIDTPPGRRGRVIVVHRADPGDAVGSCEAEQRDMWRFAVELGAEHVVELPDGEQWLIDAFRECADGPARNGTVVAVIGGSGGIGASTLAANVSIVATRAGHRSLLVDADPHGGGLDLLLGAEDATGTRWPDLKDARGHLPAGHLDAVLPRISGVSLLSCGRGEESPVTAAGLAAVLAAGRRSHDFVVVDCSRAADPVLASVVADSDDVLLLVGDHVRSTAAAAQRRTWLRSKAARLHLVRATTPRGIGEADIEHALGSAFLASVPFVPSMATRADEGELPALPKAYVNGCRAIVQAIAGVREGLRAA